MTVFKAPASLFLLILTLMVSSCSLLEEKPAPGPSLADLNAQLIQRDDIILGLENKVQSLEEQVRLLENENRECQKKNFQTDPPAKMYQKARNLLLENNFIQAGQIFKTLARRFPKHSLADNALYWLGECYYSLGQYQKAIDVFKDLIHRYPKAEKVPDALLKTGYSFLSMDDANRAGHFLKQVIKRYPFSSAAEKAQEKLGLID